MHKIRTSPPKILGGIQMKKILELEIEILNRLQILKEKKKD
ncbi:hypothetical protein [Clostridium botulinum]|nr:hypothetical protein [Clostridium botulinum]